jgi:alpha-L-rhamnosidase
MRQNPIGIDAMYPRLSWEINSAIRGVDQVAYQIMVASTKEKLEQGTGDLWNPGKINSAQSVHIIYAGKPVLSNTYFFWKVKVYTNNGESAWSEINYWQMGLLHSSDWKGKWIGMDSPFAWDSISQFSRLSARYFRKEFPSHGGITKATVFIAGMGLYELYINGKKIGDQVLAPAPTDYRKSVLYNCFDVTANIHDGTNAIAAVLGNGRFFAMRQNYKPKKINTFGYPKMLLQLVITYKDGTKKTVVTDDSWRMTADGPIRTNNEYDGEEYDATKELKGWTTPGFIDAEWLKVALVKKPSGVLIAQMNEQMKIMKSISPLWVKTLKPNVYIMDMGQNFAGWVKMQVRGIRGQKVTLRFAETLQKDGSLYRANLRDAKATDIYTISGNGIEIWQPSFVYHGFRYVEISNYPSTPSINDFEGELVYDNMSTIGQFTTSDSTINHIYRNAWWGIASDYKGMPVDCPQRNERMPWLGDRATGSQGESFVFDNAKLYAKWLDDIEQAQTAEGSIPDVAPAFWNYYSDNITWPGTYIFVANMLYQQFGDEMAITKHYASMKKWMLYMQHKYMQDYIVTKDKYGDWCVPPESLELIHAKDSSLNTDGTLIATAYYYKLLQLMQKFQNISHADPGSTDWKALSEKVKTAFNKKFFNSQKKQYSNNTITANLLPLYFGIIPDSVKEAVFEKINHKLTIDNHMHSSTGIIGIQWLMRGLTKFQHPDIAYALASSKTYPGWGYMVENGATAIWELWNGNTANAQMNSGNHVMLLGDLLIWFYENVAGIKSDDQAVAFKKIIMKPAIIDGLQFANASYHSMYGNIVSEWKKDANGFNWKITIPANAKAVIYIPATSVKGVTENGKAIEPANEIQFIKMEGNYAVFEIGSGEFKFNSKK